MIPLMVRNVSVGEGMPKICAPLTGDDTAELKKEACAVRDLPADMVEWRADHFAGAFGEDGADTDIDAVSRLIADAGKMLRSILEDKPILFTLRTAPEGGRVNISAAVYEKILTTAASDGFADMMDVELFTAGAGFSGIVAALHNMNVSVVGSSHNFEKTPPYDEMLGRLERMRDAGADVCKIAVMPRCMEDVITLLSASIAMKQKYPDTPLIALSMGREGIVSRIAGEYFGSDITFASAGKASAPGQISVADCRYIMDILHSEI